MPEVQPKCLKLGGSQVGSSCYKFGSSQSPSSHLREIVCPSDPARRMRKSFWYWFPADQLIDLHNELGDNESQNGPTVLHTFVFLYEMLGIWAYLHPLMGMDVLSFDMKAI